MPLAGLLSVLQKRELFFTAVWKLGVNDPFEMRLPKSVENVYWKEYGIDNEEEQRKDAITTDDLNRVFRGGTCINCWHMNAVESAAMWAIYSTHHGIAIQSTVGLLVDALSKTSESVKVGKVVYVDFAKPQRKHARLVVQPVFAKRKSFEHERELRASIFDLDVYHRNRREPESCPGVGVKIDPAVLIQRVYVSPTVESWITEIVRLEMRRYRLRHVPVAQSKLYSLDLT
jgi:hypothetical protein